MSNIRWAEHVTPRATVKADDLKVVSVGKEIEDDEHSYYFTIKDIEEIPPIWGYLRINRESNPQLAQAATSVYSGVGEITFTKRENGDYWLFLNARHIINYCNCAMNTEEFDNFFDAIKTEQNKKTFKHKNV